MGNKPPVKRRDVFRRMNINYRVVFIDDESLQELASFRITMRKLYILLSSMFVVVVFLTVCILLLTPLRYYIPGYGSDKARVKMIKMKQTVDSLSDLVAAQQKYEDNIRSVVTGNVHMTRDTAMLDVSKLKQEAMNSMLPRTEEIKQTALENVKKKKP
jgi:hypothetical protein